MRYIPYTIAHVPASWQKLAAKAVVAVSGLTTHEERADYINRHTHWSNQKLKKQLLALGHGKCWYCEVKPLRSHLHVDHFRPKNRVREFGNRNNILAEGYWWRAYDWSNYRVACATCNSPLPGSDEGTYGKWDYFPLEAACSYATCEAEICQEIPLLLDPTEPGDPDLLFYNEEGHAVSSAENGSLGYRRADTTIQILNFNKEIQTLEARRELARLCKWLVRQGDREFAFWLRNEPEAKDHFVGICQRIYDLIRPEAQFSRAARCFLGAEPQAWVQVILQNDNAVELLLNGSPADSQADAA